LACRALETFTKRSCHVGGAVFFGKAMVLKRAGFDGFHGFWKHI